MNGSNFLAIGALVVSLLGSLFVLAGVLYTALQKRKTDELTLKSGRDDKTIAADATYRVALVTDRDTFEQRMIARVEALQKQVDTERELRQKSEDLARVERGKMHDQIEEYKHKFADVQKALETLQREKILQSKDYQDKILEQDHMNHKLQAELTALQEKYDTLQKEYDEVLKICTELRAQLVAERGKTLENVLSIAQNIGVAEGPPRRSAIIDHIDAVSSDTNRRVRRVEQKVDDAASVALDETHETRKVEIVQPSDSPVPVLQVDLVIEDKTEGKSNERI